MTLTEIIARLEAATGADRRIDAEIARTIGCQVRRWNSATNWQWIVGTEWEQLPTFTASLDVALTLVPDGLNWLIGKGRIRPDEPLYGAQVLDGAAVAGEGETDATPAIALCIAALKARNV